MLNKICYVSRSDGVNFVTLRCFATHEASWEDDPQHSHSPLCDTRKSLQHNVVMSNFIQKHFVMGSSSSYIVKSNEITEINSNKLKKSALLQ